MNFKEYQKIYTRRYYKKHYLVFREFEKPMGGSIVSILNPSSILDLGCGIGSFLEGAFLAGCNDILGIDLSLDNMEGYIVGCICPHIEKGDILQDLNLKRNFDCVINFEVGEHIEPEGTDALISNLTKYSSQYIVMTAAPPGQKGTCHINLRERWFWIKEIELQGFKHQQMLVEKFKEAWENFVPLYLRDNLMVFEKE